MTYYDSSIVQNAIFSPEMRDKSILSQKTLSHVQNRSRHANTKATPPQPSQKSLSSPDRSSPTRTILIHTTCLSSGAAAEENHHFIVGPSRGIDAQARRYLLHEACILPERVTVYLNGAETSRLQPKLKSFEASGGKIVVVGRNHTERDVAMTRTSHYDILRYRTEAKCRVLYGEAYRKRVSGTEKNELRRQQGIGIVWSG